MVIVDDDWFWRLYKNPNFDIHEWIHNTTGCEYLINFQREDKSIDVSKWSDISGYCLYCTPDEIKSLMKTTNLNSNNMKQLKLYITLLRYNCVPINNKALVELYNCNYVLSHDRNNNTIYMDGNW